MSVNDNGTLPMPPSELSMGLGGSGLYDMSTSASATTPNSPLNGGSYTTADFRPGGGDGAGVFDMGGTEFGGYGVPVAYKEAMLRHFAPALQQDGQIGVDQDTMMMWSTMPATYECVFISSSWEVKGISADAYVLRTQDWVTYMSSMLDIAQANADPATGTVV